MISQLFVHLIFEFLVQITQKFAHFPRIHNWRKQIISFIYTVVLRRLNKLVR